MVNMMNLEKGWVKMISDRLNIEPPTVENFSDKSGQNKNQDTGFCYRHKKV